jgi:transcriptional regulator with XRE-family HTH domain
MARQQTFADRLRAAREKAGVTPYRLAQLSGITKQAISRLESGQSQPTWDTVQALARALGVSCEAFTTPPPAPAAAPPVKPRGRPRKGK